jgi:hypothetical protein
MSLLELQALEASDIREDHGRNPEESTLSLVACDSAASFTICQ